MLQNATKTVAGTAAAWMLAAMATTGQTPPPGITRTAVLENETVLVARLALAPGAREDVHTHPFSAVVVQLGEGTIDMQLGRARTADRAAGGSWSSWRASCRTRRPTWGRTRSRSSPSP